MLGRKSRTRRGVTILLGTVAVVGGAVAVSGCGSSSSASANSTNSTSAASVTIGSKTLKGVGTVLVNNQGHTLYMFVPDKQAAVTCVSACAAVWPPLTLAAGQSAVASGAVKPALIGNDANPSGGQVVTYNKWPLYTYVPDTSPGDHDGQALNVNGGLWYVMSPSGALIKTKVAA
jgi:predicted lipoprotein with Yx(FWY)xxD motif